MKLKGAIFDLDGTLLDSMPTWRTVGSEFLKRRGIETEEGFDARFRTMTLMQAAIYFKENYNIKDDEESIIKEFEEIMLPKYEKELPLKSGVLKMLKAFKKNGVKMCIATATNRPLVEAALKRLKIEDYFDGLITCLEAKKGKQFPDIYREALKIINCKKEDTVVFEDALHAVKTAKKDGFFVAGIYDRESDQWQEEIKKLSDYYILDYNDNDFIESQKEKP